MTTSADDERADPRDVARQLRGVLDEIVDPDDELTASAAPRHPGAEPSVPASATSRPGR